MTALRPPDGRGGAIGKTGGRAETPRCDVAGADEERHSVGAARGVPHRVVGVLYGRAGFTLLEVLAAAVVLVIAVAAGTGIVTLALMQSSRDASAVDDGDAALDVQWRLAGLPYASATPGEESLVAALFPHATVALNTPTAHYVPAAAGCWPGPAFVTFQEAGDRRLAAVAQFLWRTADGGWTTVPRDRLDGARFDIDTPPPVLRLELRPAGDPSRPALLSRVFFAGGPRAEGAP